MASLTEDPGKRGKTYRIGFLNADRQRKTLRIGAMPKKKAENIRGHIDHLEACLFDGSAPPPQTAAWLASVGEVLRKRMEKAGLVEREVRRIMPTVAELVDMYRDRPRWREIAERTREGYNYGFRFLASRMGNRRIDQITEAEAEDFRGFLVESKPNGAGLGRATANSVCNACSLLFRFGCKSRLITDNPFEGVQKCSVSTARRAFVDAAVVYRLIAAMDNSEWRLLVALARWGGMRCPSEPKRLKWSDIDVARGRISIDSPKTGRRELPLFPELAPFIQQRFDDAEPEDGEYVLPMTHRFTRQAFASKVTYRLMQMGEDRWPRIFHSMRSTRQTELVERFPSHVVAGWLGNSVETANKHYLQTTEGHFAEALKAAQIPAQTATATQRQPSPTS